MERPDLADNNLRIHWVRVTNLGDTPFTDRWDGIPVTIPPSKSENLQLDMAGHFFGYHYDVSPETMLRHTAKRQGWNTPAHLIADDTGKTLAERLFAKLKIEPVVYKMVEVKPDLDQPIPADPEPPAGPPPADYYPAPSIEDLPALPRRKMRGE